MNNLNIFLFLKPKSDVSCLQENYTLRQAMEKMQPDRYPQVPILREDGTYFGTISEGDILWFIKEHGQFDIKDYEKYRLADVQVHKSYKGISISSEMDELLELALDQNFVPVLDDRGIFIGIIKRRDVLNYFIHASVKED